MRLPDFSFGNRLFNTNWVKAPASVKSLDGLGPLFNRVSCSGCHTRDGRGRPPEPGEEGPMISMLMRLSVKGEAPRGGPKPHPVYGLQLQSRAVQGVKPEGRVRVRYEKITRTFPGGGEYVLLEPHYEFTGLNYGPLGEDVLFSPRVAPPVFGLGLLEAVSEETIRSRADPDDADGDGISGRPNRVYDAASGEIVIGRFGWKANEPNLRQQTAGAASGDMGLTNSMFSEGSPSAEQLKSIHEPIRDGADLSEQQLDRLVFYLRTLAVPARRDTDDPAVRRGERLFARIGCATCHTPTMTTGEHELDMLAGQTIHPYTDLLLHDMGPALADGRPDFEATGREWRTPPLWGIGLTETVNGHTRFLHDGRARNLQEAILWHGGEAERSREAYERLSKEEREAVLAFLRSL